MTGARMSDNGTPGTAALYGLIQNVQTLMENDAQRRRAMLLSWVDEAERDCGYGNSGKPPRTAQIRAWWRDQGEPEIHIG